MTQSSEMDDEGGLTLGTGTLLYEVFIDYVKSLTCSETLHEVWLRSPGHNTVRTAVLSNPHCSVETIQEVLSLEDRSLQYYYVETLLQNCKAESVLRRLKDLLTLRVTLQSYKDFLYPGTVVITLSSSYR